MRPRSEPKKIVDHPSAITSIFDGSTLDVGKDESIERSFLKPAQAEGELGWFQHYRVFLRLGQGGMGIVYRAEDTHLRRQVALKVMNPNMAADLVARKRFLREARAMAAIQHENVVVVYHVGMAKNRSLEVPFLAMQFLDGETLEQRLIRVDQFAPRDVARIGREIAEGLAAAHARGLVHRDIKPSNVWLAAPHDRAKVLDFGLACLLDGHSRLSRTGQIIGTPYYMSPEQALGEPVDPRTDLFALGCVLYAMLAGAAPFAGATISAVLKMLTTDEPAALLERTPHTPAKLAAFVQRLMAKAPADRPASAAEVAAALATIERECAGIGNGPSSPPAPPSGISARIKRMISSVIQLRRR